MDRPIRDNTGSLLTKLSSQLYHQLPINTGNITKEDIKRALTRLKNGKAAGSYNIPPEALKAGGQTSIDILYDLFNTIWTTEEIPDDWLDDGLLVKPPKKGDTSLLQELERNHSAVHPQQMLSSINLERMRVHVDGRLREEREAGFRNGGSFADQIATLCIIIIDQPIECLTSLYLNFVDFEKAFDSIDHQVLWALLRHYYGLPEKFIRMIQLFYNNFRCQVIHGGPLQSLLK